MYFGQILSDPKIITAYGPFVAAFFTGLITIIAVIISSDATRKASKQQSDSTLASVQKNLEFEKKSKRIDQLTNAFTILMTKIYVLERDPNVLTHDTEAIFNSVAGLNILLTDQFNEPEIKNLLSELMLKFYAGDLSYMHLFRERILKEINKLIEINSR